jgi:hypothetical protein
MKSLKKGGGRLLPGERDCLPGEKRWLETGKLKPPIV